MQLRITHVQEEVDGVKTFFLTPADGSVLAYKAGQFLTFPRMIAGKELRRSYSFSSAPDVDDLASFTVKRVANGLMSRRLIDYARVGDVLEATGGATGLFTLPQKVDAYDAVWLFAAGIGITPLYSLLKAMLAIASQQRIVLVYSNRNAGATVFLTQLNELERLYKDRFKIVHLWSEARDLRRARLSKESFPLLIADSLTDEPAKTLCYLCGPSSYMWLLQLLLQDAGVPAANVRREVFTVSKEVPHRVPADKDPHQVEIIMGGLRFSFINQYPFSILRSAKAAGISLPYSCNAGQCGSCTAVCSAGKVWMSYNEVLTEKDILAGRVLTCTGHAVAGDVVLNYL